MNGNREYEIRLYRDDGTLSVVVALAAKEHSIAARKARQMLNQQLTRAHIWQDQRLILTFEYVDGLAIVS